MPITFDPNFDSQPYKPELLPDGAYNFKVIESIDKVSNAGNSMVFIKARIINNGKTFILFDNLMDHPKMLWKVKHFCESTGKMEIFKSGKIEAMECFEAEGLCIIGTEPDNRNTEINRNIIKDYTESFEQVKAKSEQKPTNEFVDSDIPF